MDKQHFYKMLLSSLARRFLREKGKTMITWSYYLFSALIVINGNCYQSSSFVVYVGSMSFKMRLVHPRLSRSSKQQKLTLGWNFVRKIKKCFQKSILKQKRGKSKYLLKSSKIEAGWLRGQTWTKIKKKFLS